MLRRAYSTFECKAVNEDQRIIEGIATTPQPDRLGDIVEPDGAEFKLPLPLLMYHNSREPVGHVEKAKVSKNGISIVARFLKIDEPGKLKDRLDEAWQSIKHGLVRGLSIGFAPIGEPENIPGTWSQRFIRWNWLELSVVTIPANVEATIQNIKSADLTRRAASGEYEGLPVVFLNSSPGASGQTSRATPKGHAMLTIAQQIASFEAKRAAQSERMSAIMAKAAEEGRTLDQAETQEYDALKAEVKQIDEHLVRLREHEAAAVARAKPANGGGELPGAPRPPASNIISVKPNLEPGQKMARYVIALKRARGNLTDALAIVQNHKAWMDTSPELALVLKAAVAAGDTTTVGWAAELVYAQNLASEFIEYLRPMTIIGRIPNFRRVPFNVRMGSQTAGSTGYWVGQGLPIPVSKLTTSSASLGITKAAGLVALDEELVRSSSPSAELLVRDELGQAVIHLLDVSFIDPNQAGTTNVQPASVTNLVTAIPASGTAFANVQTDVKALFAPMINANMKFGGAHWIMPETTALSLSLMQNALGQPEFPGININGGTWYGLPVVTSQHAAFTEGADPLVGNIIVLVIPSEIFMADDGQVTISISNEASIQMLDNPTNQSTGVTAPTTLVSMFQTNSEAIKAVRFINWLKRRSQAVGYIKHVAYA